MIVCLSSKFKKLLSLNTGICLIICNLEIGLNGLKI